MSILLIITLAICIGLIIGGIYRLITINSYNDTKHDSIAVGIGVLIALICTLVGIGINTQDAKVYCTKFEAQKATIEYSLNCEELSGLERVELVNKAVELNGELAERKAWAETWHFVYYDADIYDNVEFIKFDGGTEE